MRTLSLWLVVISACCGTAGEAGKKVDYDTDFTAYFVKNTAPVKQNPAHLVVTDKKQFDEIFGVAFTMKKPKTLDPKAFDTKIAVVVVTKGTAVTKYTVEQVTAANGELRVQYRASTGAATTATYASPLIVLADGRKYSRVVFIENGKEAAKVDVPRQ